jgi:hypothetical protein
MKFRQRKKPRTFSPLMGIELKDMGTVCLKPDEQLTFVTESGLANDVCRKEWGFYLSNSNNANLKDKGFKTAIVLSPLDPPRIYVNLVELKKMKQFERYMKKFNLSVICWLDEWFEQKKSRG